MKSHIVLLPVIALSIVVPTIGQTFEWRYKGGTADGYALGELSLADLNGSTLANRYRGGDHDGFDGVGAAVDLTGNDWTKKYMGGSNDGYAMLGLPLSDLVGSSLLSHFYGGSYDGYAMLGTPLSDLVGSSLLSHFTGGSHDGYAMLGSGFLDLQGQSLNAHFSGGSYDGFAMLGSDLLDLQGSSLAARAHGGNYDGYAMVVSELLDLAGSALANRYRGGNYDGYAAADFSPPPGNVPQFVVKAFLQGPFGASSMSISLNNNHYLPVAHPYGGSPWFYMGTDAVGSIPSSSVVDWVLCEIRTGAAPTTTLEQHAGFIKSDGSIVGLDGISPLQFDYSPVGSYYFVLHHRNHLPVMTATPIFAGPLGPGTIDFTTAMASAYGTNPMKEVVTGTFGLWAGDVNANGQVKYNGSANDRASIFNRIGSLTGIVSGYYPEDVNMNGQVKYNGYLNDRTIIYNNIGSLTGARNSQVP